MRLMFTVVALVYLSTLGFAISDQTAGGATAPAPPSQRFDYEVRADFFAGLKGDAKRFEKAMARCEEVLAVNPNHAEALVWHGSGLVTRAGRLLQSGDMGTGMELWTRGLAEMNKAAALEPDNPGVRIPRGATLFEASRFVPPQQAPPLLKLALGDYEHALQLQRSTFSRLSDHAKGELLFGLAEGWARAGDKQKARDYFTRLIAEAPSSGRTAYSRAWLDGTPPAQVGGCVGCH